MTDTISIETSGSVYSLVSVKDVTVAHMVYFTYVCIVNMVYLLLICLWSVCLCEFVHCMHADAQGGQKRMRLNSCFNIVALSNIEAMHERGYERAP